MKRNFTASLRHKVILEKKTQTSDGAGGYTTTWEEVATLWTSIEKRRGSERVHHGQLTATSTHIFRLRYTNIITPDMRFCFDGRIFNIRSIENKEERNHQLEIHVEEGIAA